MNSLERGVLKNLPVVLDDPLKAYFPGFRLQVYLKGRKKIDLDWGSTFTFYDLASLTKTIFTTPLIMQAVDEGKVSLSDEVHEYLPWYRKTGVSLESLLTQTSGLPWWRPFYLKYQSRPTLNARWKELQTFLARAQLKKNGRSVYSDLGFMLLGHWAEELFATSLTELCDQTMRRLGLESIHFNPSNKRKYKKLDYAPTERCRRRGKLLQGQVHDDNCYALGGVSSHAGLFGSIDDVSKWGLKIYRGGFLKSSGNEFASQETFLRFARRAVPARTGDWGLGWWKPSPKGFRSSAGDLFSKQSVGGLGFTGNSIWYDPKVDLLVVLLSNRVHPTRRNKKITELRPKLHSLIYRTLVG